MPINSSEFKDLIFQTLRDTPAVPVPIKHFYNMALEHFDLDGQDLTSTVHKGKVTGEPSWKRNLRNALQTSKNSGEIVNSSVGFWRLPTPDNASYIDPESAWTTVKTAALNAKTAGEQWRSPVDGQRYRIEDVGKNITIIRDSTGTTEKISKQDVLRSFISLNAAGGSVGRRAMLYVVAKEACVVHLHPKLTWDESFQYVSVVSSGMTIHQKISVIKQISEASNDDDIYQPYVRRIRKGQPALRKKLLEVYNDRCCVTKTGPVNVLQAAHIESHAQGGNNHSTNALLLRSDIHDLFDDHLILIEPLTLKVFVCPDLKDTIYWELNGERLLARSDGASPDVEMLHGRWQKYRWI